MEDEGTDTRKRHHRKKAKIEDPPSQPVPSTPPPSSPLQLPQMDSEVEDQDTIPGRLYLCQILDQPNMLVTAADDEHAKEIVWAKLHEKPEVHVTSISLFEPSIRFIQNPDRNRIMSDAQRLQPYSVFICMDHVFWGRPGCVVVADSDFEADSLLDSFFKEYYIIGWHTHLEKVSLANHRIYY